MDDGTERMSQPQTGRVNVLGADRAALEQMLASDPATLIAALEDILAQTPVEELAEVRAAQEAVREHPKIAPHVTVMPDLIDILGAVIGNTGISGWLDGLGLGVGKGVIGGLNTGVERGSSDMEEAPGDPRAWLGWLDLLLRPYHQTGKVLEEIVYAPIFDLQCDASAAKSISSSAVYAESMASQASLSFKCPGIAMDAKFEETLSHSLAFEEVAGAHQLSLPVRLEVVEWLNAGTGRKKYSARVVGIEGPTQFDAFSERYLRPKVAYKKPYIIGGLKSLDKTISLERGMSAAAHVPVPIASGVSLNMSYEVSVQTALTVSLTGAKREYELSEGQDAPLFLSVSRP